MKEKFKILILASILSLGVGTVSAEWQLPNHTPPTCPTGERGCDEPINVGANGQLKHGGLTVGYSVDDAQLGFSVAHGNVGIGTTQPTQKLDVMGYVRGATGLCIADDCRTSWPAAGSGGSFSGTENVLPKFGAGGTTLVDSGVKMVSGKVGISMPNNENPTAKLDVNGDVRIRGGSPGAGKVLVSVDANGTAQWGLPVGQEAVAKYNVTQGNQYTFDLPYEPDYIEVQIGHKGSPGFAASALFTTTLTAGSPEWAFTGGYDGGPDDALRAVVTWSGNKTVKVKPTELFAGSGANFIMVVGHKATLID